MSDKEPTLRERVDRLAAMGNDAPRAELAKVLQELLHLAQPTQQDAPPAGGS